MCIETISRSVILLPHELTRTSVQVAMKPVSVVTVMMIGASGLVILAARRIAAVSDLVLISLISTPFMQELNLHNVIRVTCKVQLPRISIPGQSVMPGKPASR